MLFHLQCRMLLSSLLVCGFAASDTILCGRYQSYTSATGQYRFSTNEWGNDGSGSQCIEISPDDSAFSATWQWVNNSLNVHAFPNIKLNSPLLPLQLSNLSSLNVSAEWRIFPSDPNSGMTLDTLGTAANVIIDMFLDSDPSIANSTTKPKYEIMVWLAAVGGKRPIGFSSAIKNPPTEKLGDYTFSLYSGSNANGQFVYSWLLSSQITSIDCDISPLIHYLWRHQYFDDTNFLGIVQFGSESFHSTSNVTFSTTNFGLDLQYGPPQPDPDSLAPGPNASSPTWLWTFFTGWILVWV